MTLNDEEGSIIHTHTVSLDRGGSQPVECHNISCSQHFGCHCESFRWLRHLNISGSYISCETWFGSSCSKVPLLIIFSKISFSSMLLNGNMLERHDGQDQWLSLFLAYATSEGEYNGRHLTWEQWFPKEHLMVFSCLIILLRQILQHDGLFSS